MFSANSLNSGFDEVYQLPDVTMWKYSTRDSLNIVREVGYMQTSGKKPVRDQDCVDIDFLDFSGNIKSSQIFRCQMILLASKGKVLSLRDLTETEEIFVSVLFGQDSDDDPNALTLRRVYQFRNNFSGVPRGQLKQLKIIEWGLP